jgi:two-component system CheB/CheR fusion protein
MSDSRIREFDALLDHLRRTRGFDFTAYKPPSLMRRIDKRMQDVNIKSFADYIDYLEVHPDEFGQLFNVILINVTSFFRDEMAWDFLREHVVPEMIANRRADAVRIWTAGCASGEETYSIAMLFADPSARR